MRDHERQFGGGYGVGASVAGIKMVAPNPGSFHTKHISVSGINPREKGQGIESASRRWEMEISNKIQYILYIKYIAL